jgi:preprotein translocase subunit SecD
VSPPRELGRDTSATLSVQHRSAPNALLLLLRSSSYKFEFYISESGPWTEKKLRYLTMRYITYPIVVATIGAKGLPQSLIASLLGCSRFSTSLSGSIYV